MSGRLVMQNTVGLTRKRQGLSWWKRFIWWNRERKAANPSMATLKRQLLLLQIQETQMRTNALIRAENAHFGGPAVEMGHGSIAVEIQSQEDADILAACERAIAEEEGRAHRVDVEAPARVEVYTGDDEEETVGRLDEPEQKRARA